MAAGGEADCEAVGSGGREGGVGACGVVRVPTAVSGAELPGFQDAVQRVRDVRDTRQYA